MKLGDSLNEMKKWIVLVLVGVLAFWGLNNLELIFDVLGNIYRVFSPFILGFVLAYILNIPMMKVEKLLKKAIPDKYAFLREIYIQFNDGYVFDSIKAEGNAEY